MNRLRWLARIGTFIGLFWLHAASFPSAHGGDWTQFRGPGRHNVTAESGWGTDWPEAGPPLLWTAEVGNGNGTVVVAGTNILIQGCLIVVNPEAAPIGDLRGQEAGELKGKKAKHREVLSCLDVDTGNIRWQYEIHPQVVVSYNSPHATPSIDGKHVFLHGQLGVLACLDVTSGKEAWRRDLVSDLGVSVKKYGASSSPLVTSNAVYIIDGTDKTRAVGVYAFDRRTGTNLWGTVYEIGGQNPHGSPLRATVDGRDTILCHLGEAAVGLHPETGRELWNLDYMETYPECKLGRCYSSESWPMVMPDGLIVDRIWNDVPGRGGDDKSIGSLGRTVAFRVHDGAVVVEWENPKVSYHFLGNQVWEGYLYGFNMRAAPGEKKGPNGLLVCLDLRDGRVMWQSDEWSLPGVKEAVPKWRRDACPTMLIADGKMIINDGIELILGECSPQGFRRLSGFAVDLTAWSSPVLANGRLYVRGGSTLRCYDLQLR